MPASPALSPFTPGKCGERHNQRAREQDYQLLSTLPICFSHPLNPTLRYSNACFSCAFAFHSWSERRTTGLAVSQLGGASSTQAPERAPQTQRASPAGAPQRGAAPLSTDLAVTQGIGASSARARTTRQTAPGRPINPMLQSPAELLRSRHQSADTRRDHESVNEAQIRGETVNQ